MAPARGGQGAHGARGARPSARCAGGQAARVPWPAAAPGALDPSACDRAPQHASPSVAPANGRHRVPIRLSAALACLRVLRGTCNTRTVCRATARARMCSGSARQAAQPGQGLARGRGAGAWHQARGRTLAGSPCAGTGRTRGAIGPDAGICRPIDVNQVRATPHPSSALHKGFVAALLAYGILASGFWQAGRGFIGLPGCEGLLFTSKHISNQYRLLRVWGVGTAAPSCSPAGPLISTCVAEQVYKDVKEARKREPPRSACGTDRGPGRADRAALSRSTPPPPQGCVPADRCGAPVP